MRNLTILLVLIPLNLFSQWNYVGRINDVCSPTTSYNYTFSNDFNVGAHGANYSLYRNGSPIKTGGGTMGCCSIDTLKVFTDSIVFLIINNAGIFQCYRTLDAGNTWTLFNGWADIEIADISILNKNTGYVLSRGVYFDKKRISIKRISDINSRYLIKDDTINISLTDVYLTDTIFGESYCPNVQNIGFKIQKNGININYHINISQIPLSITDYRQNKFIRISPNPTYDKLIIDCEETYSIIIYNNFGQRLRVLSMNKGRNTIDMSNYESGLYFLSFYNNDKYLMTKKIIRK
jgi:hypothetical protein